MYLLVAFVLIPGEGQLIRPLPYVAKTIQPCAYDYGCLLRRNRGSAFVGSSCPWPGTPRERAGHRRTPPSRFRATASRELRTRVHRNKVAGQPPRHGASIMKQAVRTDACDFGATPPRSASMFIIAPSTTDTAPTINEDKFPISGPRVNDRANGRRGHQLNPYLLKP